MIKCLFKIDKSCNRLLVFRHESIMYCKTLPSVERDLQKNDCVSPMILNISDQNVNLLFIIYYPVCSKELYFYNFQHHLYYLF